MSLPLPVQAYHGRRRTAAPEPIPDDPFSGVFGRLTPAGGPFYRRDREGVRGNDPFGPRRAESDRADSFNNSSLCRLSASAVGIFVRHRYSTSAACG